MVAKAGSDGAIGQAMQPDVPLHYPIACPLPSGKPSRSTASRGCSACARQPVHGWMAATAVVFLTLRSVVIVPMAAERNRSKLIDLAHRDALTGVLNRSGLAQHLPIKRPQSLALLAIDIDSFKQLNDEHGDVVGGEILRLTSRGWRKPSCGPAIFCPARAATNSWPF